MMWTCLLALGLVAALQVPSLAEDVVTTATESQEIVDKHNALRRRVKPSASNMLRMSWSSEAAANAKAWANKCTLKHSPESNRVISTSGCGENLYMSGSKKSWSDAIQSWYDEVQDWKYGVGSVNGQVVGHFTQMVWYRSNLIGCAMARCPGAKYEYFYVCHYCPPGNFQYKRPYTAGTPCEACPAACDNGLCTNPCPYMDQYSNCPELKKEHGCNNQNVASWCPASCKCTNQII